MTYHGDMTLEKLIQAKPGPKIVHAVMCAFIESLSVLHDKNIIHNDVKLNNILIEFNSLFSCHITLIDFGWSTFLGEIPYALFEKDHIPHYPWLSPSLANRGTATVQTDLFSVGFMLL